MKQPHSDHIIFYHANCLDGFGAAFAHNIKYESPAECYIPSQYQSDFWRRLNLKNKNIFILDFSFSTEDMVEMYQEAKTITVIDHHASAEKKLIALQERTGPACNVIFDMEHSGAYLAWQHFNGLEVPDMIKMIEDRDLWKYEVRGTKEFNAFMWVEDRSFVAWRRYLQSFHLEKAIGNGQAVLQANNLIALSQAHRAFKMGRFKHSGNGHIYRTMACNASTLPSETGYSILELYPEAEVAAVYYHDADGTKWSLRSRKSDNHIDVSHIATQFGGGGHKSAAGFKEDKRSVQGWFKNEW